MMCPLPDIRSHDSHDYRLSQSKDHCLVLSVRNKGQWRFLASPSFPKKEAERWVRSLNLQKNEPHVPLLFLGVSSVYIIEELIKQGFSHPILVLEFSQKAWTCLSRDTQCAKIFDHPQVDLHLSQDLHVLTAHVIKKFPSGKIKKIVALRALKDHSPHPWSVLLDRLGDIIHRSAISKHTLHTFENVWLSNSILNTFYYIRNPGIQHLIDRIKGVPILIVASGPSLSFQIEAIKRWRSHYILIAVNDAVLLLYQNGIKADFGVIVDPQHIVSQFFPSSDVAHFFISEISTSPSLVRRLNERLFFASSQLPGLEKLIDDAHAAPENILPCGGSVVTSAWSFARLLQPLWVAFAGLDLALSEDGRHHACGSISELRQLFSHTRLSPAFGLKRGSEHKRYRVRSWSGCALWSEKKLLLFRQWLDEQCASASFPVYDTTPDGIEKNAMTFQSLNDLCEASAGLSVSCKDALKGISCIKREDTNLRELDNRITNILDDLIKVIDTLDDGDLSSNFIHKISQTTNELLSFGIQSVIENHERGDLDHAVFCRHLRRSADQLKHDLTRLQRQIKTYVG